MDVRKLMLMAGALVFAAICAVTARSMFGGAGQQVQANAPAEPTGPQVLVATKTLPVGTAKCYAHRGRNGLRVRLSA